jgi:hypothetical protein
MPFDDSVDGERPRPVPCPGPVEERLEDVRHVIESDPVTGVGDGEAGVPAGLGALVVRDERCP